MASYCIRRKKKRFHTENQVFEACILERAIQLLGMSNVMMKAFRISLELCVFINFECVFVISSEIDTLESLLKKTLNKILFL